MKSTWAKQKGFTIVELLIVIVVIGILAAITIVAYNGIQQRARDTQRKADLAAVIKGFQVYKIDKDDYISTGSGCGGAGNGEDWFSYVNGNPSSYPLSISGCLKSSGAISADIKDPSGQTFCLTSNPPASCHAYLKYNCGTSVYLFANLESVAQSSTATDITCQPSIDTSYGMNYFVKAD